MQWNPAFSNFRMNSMAAFLPQMPMQHNIQYQASPNTKGQHMPLVFSHLI
jgi:hypothetical protein